MNYAEYQQDLQRIHESEVYGQAVFATAARLTRNTERKAKWRMLKALEDGTTPLLGIAGTTTSADPASPHVRPLTLDEIRPALGDRGPGDRAPAAQAGDSLMLTTLEAAAAIFGLAGAFLLARNGRWAAFGWPLFLASNAAWLAFAWLASHPWLGLQQVGFTVTSLMGIWTWLVKPRLARAALEKT